MPDKAILDFLKKSMMLKVQYEWFYYIAGLIDNDEKLRSVFLKKTEHSKQFKTGVECKNHTSMRPK